MQRKRNAGEKNRKNKAPEGRLTRIAAKPDCTTTRAANRKQSPNAHPHSRFVRARRQPHNPTPDFARAETITRVPYRLRRAQRVRVLTFPAVFSKPYRISRRPNAVSALAQFVANLKKKNESTAPANGR
jgi:hypothetical protein